jgi:hypothetical protein
LVFFRGVQWKQEIFIGEKLNDWTEGEEISRVASAFRKVVVKIPPAHLYLGQMGRRILLAMIFMSNQTCLRIYRTKN